MNSNESTSRCLICCCIIDYDTGNLVNECNIFQTISSRLPKVVSPWEETEESLSVTHIILWNFLNMLIVGTQDIFLKQTLADSLKLFTDALNPIAQSCQKVTTLGLCVCFLLLYFLKLGNFYLGKEYVLEQNIIMSQEEMIVKVNIF